MAVEFDQMEGLIGLLGVVRRQVGLRQSDEGPRFGRVLLDQAHVDAVGEFDLSALQHGDGPADVLVHRGLGLRLHRRGLGRGDLRRLDLVRGAGGQQHQTGDGGNAVKDGCVHV